MSFGINIGALWESKPGAKLGATGKCTLPACVTLDSGRGHWFGLKRRDKKKSNEPDFDLILYEGEEDKKGSGGLGGLGGLGLGAPERQPGDDIPFDGAGAP